MADQEIGLDPCPFCGDEKNLIMTVNQRCTGIHKGEKTYSVMCVNCGVSVHLHDTASNTEVAIKWNTRPNK